MNKDWVIKRSLMKYILWYKVSYVDNKLNYVK